MNISQYILLGLIVLTTWGAFVEAALDSGYKVTFTRLMLALAVPLIWIYLIVYPPFAAYSFPKSNEPSSWWFGFFIMGMVLPILSLLLVVIVPT